MSKGAKKFRGLLAAKHQDALDMVRDALSHGNGVYYAAELLEVGMTTLNRHAKDWPELNAMLRGAAIPLELRGILGGNAVTVAELGDKPYPKRKSKRVKT